MTEASQQDQGSAEHREQAAAAVEAGAPTFEIEPLVGELRGDIDRTHGANQEIGKMWQDNVHLVADARRSLSVIETERSHGGGGLNGTVYLATLAGAYGERTGRMQSASDTVRSGASRIHAGVGTGMTHARDRLGSSDDNTDKHTVDSLADVNQIAGRMVAQAGGLQHAAHALPSGLRLVDAVVQLAEALGGTERSSDAIDAAIAGISGLVGQIDQSNQDIGYNRDLVRGHIERVQSGLDTIARMRRAQ